jgi:hypothetical protein
MKLFIGPDKQIEVGEVDSDRVMVTGGNNLWAILVCEPLILKQYVFTNTDLMVMEIGVEGGMGDIEDAKKLSTLLPEHLKAADEVVLVIGKDHETGQYHLGAL